MYLFSKLIMAVSGLGKNALSPTFWQKSNSKWDELLASPSGHSHT
jgi:hypothetical protein